MTAPRLHWTTAEIQDILPTDVDVHQVGGLIDIYLDTNHVVHQRVRLTYCQAVKLQHQLARHLSETT